MTVAYAIVTALTIAYCLFSAGADFVRWERVGVAMDTVGVPRSWMPWLGVPKAAAALGLLIGFWIPVIAMAAAAGLVLFFAAAVVTHWRARDYSFGLQYPFLVLAIATLALRAAA
ncbi:DoxX family protein [Streptomyces sp. NPDC048442]|uniref:DoxX family protein n=1 Tax=Streptomyces sp. NPDC048442 TaxID=3154823 RepID=UPI003428668B